MSEPVSSIRNLGPASDKSFARAGINDADHLRRIGADAAYEMLLKTGTRPHFIGYYALAMGLQGRPWNDCRGDEKTALRAKFENLKSKAGERPKSNAAIEQILDQIGVIDTARRP